MSQRLGRVQRRTSETDIEVELCLDGGGRIEVDTGIGFFDHMLTAFARHGLFDLKLKCRGDLHVDAHHSVEDTGICLGQALSQALGDHADLEFGWEQPLDSDTGLKGIIATENGPAAGLSVETRFEKERYWTFTREDGSFDLRVPSVDRTYLVRVAGIGDKEIWSDELEVEAHQIVSLGELVLDILVEQG